MSLFDVFLKVNASFRCPVCGNTDRCLVSKDHPTEPSRGLCVRKQSDDRWGQAGWLWRRGSSDPAPPLDRRCYPGLPPDFDPATCDRFFNLAQYCDLYLNKDAKHHIGHVLGISGYILNRLGMGWSPEHGALTFPMQVLHDYIVGIRLRTLDGIESAIKGSSDGLFIPKGLYFPNQRILICQGVFNTAAVVEMDYYAVGLPSYPAATTALIAYVSNHAPTSLVIMANNDGDAEGAEQLAAKLVPHCPDIRIVRPPARFRDVLEWKRDGAEYPHIEEAIEAADPQRLTNPDHQTTS